MARFILANGGDAAVNLDAIARVEINTGGVVRLFYGPGSTDFYTVDFGATDQDARDGLKRALQAFDPLG